MAHKGIASSAPPRRSRGADATAMIGGGPRQTRRQIALHASGQWHGVKDLVADGFNAASIHGNKTQGQRDRAIKAFSSGEITILVATDVAARGIDIPDVRYVYNYDLPNVAENYVHRIGRTARAGASGRAVAFCAPDETGALRDIEKVLKTRIGVASGERKAAPSRSSQKPKAPNKSRRRRRRGKPGRIAA